MKENFKNQILGKKIKSFNFYKMLDYRFNKMRVHGIVWMEDGEIIQVRFNEFKIINELGQVSGMVLKSNPEYNKIKRKIAIWFQTYRIGVKSSFRERISKFRDACQQADYSLRLKMIQRGRISFNHYFNAS